MFNVRLHFAKRFFFAAEFFVELRELKQNLWAARIRFHDSSKAITRFSSRVRYDRLRCEELVSGIECGIDEHCRFIAGLALGIKLLFGGNRKRCVYDEDNAARR